jgi:ribosomal protein S18 acetylase RimI-like enzyme
MQAKAIFLDDGVVIRRATPDDFGRVLAIVQDAARYLQDVKGMTMWRLYLTDEGVAHVRSRVNGDVGTEVYLAVRDDDPNSPLGAFSLQWSDPEIWGEQGDDGLAGYVHMLNVHRSARGTQLGSRLLRFAEGVIAERGRGWFRLDCWRGSAFLAAYYPQRGFTLVRDDVAEDRLLWAKRLAP